MSSRELIETFGDGLKGQRKVSGEMVAWLLSVPDQRDLLVASALKKPIHVKIDPQVPRNKIAVMPEPPVTFEIKLDPL